MNKRYTDIELVSLLKAGNKSALADIYERYHGVLFAHAYKRLPDKEEVRDILQDVFLYLWRNRETITITSSLSAYLYVSVRSRILNVFRNKKVRNAYIQSLHDFMESGQELVEERVRERELIQLVEQEVAALPPQMRRIFEMSRFKDMSHKEIAENLDISPQTVRTQVRNALRILRAKLGVGVVLMFWII